ncbi:MAG TPA: DUF4178 domain-containing protein [Pyrinomonadaceae bacterium]|nr:DUF4178 domain-containing protein [Pyrinomonadaceae bacterium]
MARTDRGLQDLGKVAEVAESESPLKIGLRGTFKGTGFELTGRAQYRHEMGGYWDEWYATFSNGWVGWLAEAQGRFYLTFYQPLPQGTTLPAFDQLQIGQNVEEIPAKLPLMVTEKGVAAAAAADGEIPYQLVPNEKNAYADLSGRDSEFATIDYSTSPPWVFLGRQVTLADIGLGDARPVQREARRVSAAAMGCPNCGGPLNLIAPDKSERVTCPNCNSLLDVNQGNLTYLHALAPTDADKNYVLPVGAEGTFKDGVKFKIIGAMTRSVLIEGTKYFWHEYLLYNPSVGFRWLVHSDNHWNFVEPVNPAEVEQIGMARLGTAAKYNGRAFKLFQDAQAVVEYVKGEFYWRVEQGETVRAIDYVSAPLMLSEEISGSEMNWSAGVYMTNAEIEKAFGVKDLPKPWSVAPNQPFTGSFYYTWGLLPLIALLVVAVFLVPITGLPKSIYSKPIVLPPMPNAQAAQTAFSEPFDLQANRNVRITANAPVNNSWVDLDVDLVNEQNQEIESVNVPVEEYHGVEDGESWSEGGQSQDASLSSLPGGKYTLRVEGTWQNWQQEMPVNVKVEQNVSRGVNFGCAFIALLIVPLLGIFRKFSFETRKWKDSMFSTSGGSDE